MAVPEPKSTNIQHLLDHNVATSSVGTATSECHLRLITGHWISIFTFAISSPRTAVLHSSMAWLVICLSLSDGTRLISHKDLLVRDVTYMKNFCFLFRSVISRAY